LPLVLYTLFHVSSCDAWTPICVTDGSGPDTCYTGVVQANVGQKLLKCNILRVFTMSPFKILI
jgi:hypothetical protein